MDYVVGKLLPTAYFFNFFNYLEEHLEERLEEHPEELLHSKLDPLRQVEKRSFDRDCQQVTGDEAEHQGDELNHHVVPEVALPVTAQGFVDDRGNNTTNRNIQQARGVRQLRYWVPHIPAQHPLDRPKCPVYIKRAS